MPGATVLVAKRRVLAVMDRSREVLGFTKTARQVWDAGRRCRQMMRSRAAVRHGPRASDHDPAS
jgi:hypothetical protein